MAPMRSAASSRYSRGKGGDAFSANASAGYGTYQTSGINGGVSGTGGDGAWRYALQAGHRQSDGFNAIFNPNNFSYNPDRDGYQDNNVSGSLSYRFAPEQEVSAQALYSRLNAQFDSGPGFDDRTITTVQSYSVASRNRLTSIWKSELSVAETRDDSDTQTAFGPSRFDTRQRLYSWQNDLMPGYGHLILLAERREEHVDSDTAFDVTSRNTNSVAGIYQIREGQQSAQASLRRDDSSQFGARTTGTVAYGYEFTANLRATASYGTAFKAPTFNDLYFPGFSNPDLKPETSRNTELALRYSGDGLTAGIVAYRNRVNDLIVFECDADFNCAPQNVADATLEGVTIELGGRVGQFSFKGSIDLQNPTDNSNGLLLPRRARRHGSLSVLRDAGALKHRRRGRCVIGAFRRRRQYAPHGRLRAAQPDGRIRFCKSMVAAGASEQCVRQALRAGRRLQHRGHERFRRGALDVLMLLRCHAFASARAYNRSEILVRQRSP